MSRESVFQEKVIEKIRIKYPGAVILKTDPNYIQGFPDWLILYNTYWAALETKRQKNAVRQANQGYWINYLNDMSFASFVYPENVREVFSGLHKTLVPDWTA